MTSLLQLYAFSPDFNSPFVGPERSREVDWSALGGFEQHWLLSTMALTLAPALGPTEVVALERSLPAAQLVARDFGPDALGTLITLKGSTVGDECVFLANALLAPLVRKHRERLQAAGAPSHPGLNGLVESVLGFLSASAGFGYDVLSFSDFTVRFGD